ncbi:MAG: hypothetical protein ACMUHY_02050 [Thermoplasmatota archaeon]
MARRRIIHEEEEVEEKEKDKKPAFQPKEFNETEFLQTENKSAKMIYISLGAAVVAGIVSFILMRVLYSLDTGMHFTIPLISPVGFAILVVYLFNRFGINVRELEWKKWLENGFMFLLAWFVVWMISMNPPISDFSDPQIQEPILDIKTVQGMNYTYVQGNLFINDQLNDYIPPSNIENQSIENTTIEIDHIVIHTVISDNNKVDRVEIKFQQKFDGAFVDIEEPGAIGINLTKDSEFVPKGDLEDEVDGTWLQTDPEAWKDNLWTIDIDAQKIKSEIPAVKDGWHLKVIYRVWDTWNNYSEKEYSFKIKF